MKTISSIILCTLFVTSDLIRTVLSEENSNLRRRDSSNAGMSQEGITSGQQLTRVWVQYKKGTSHKSCLTSLQAHLMSAVGANETEAWGLLRPDEDKIEFQSTATNLPYRMHYDFFDFKLNSVAMTVNAKMLQALKSDPKVVSVSRDYMRYLTSSSRMGRQQVMTERREASSALPPEDIMPYGILQVKADQVWAKGYTGQGVKVCVIDSGLDFLDQVDFDQTWQGLPDTMTERWFYDGLGHGTHVAGTIAARRNGEGVVGVAPDAELFIYRVFDNNGDEQDPQPAIPASLVAFAALSCFLQGAKVINMSMQGPVAVQAESDVFQFLFNMGVVNVAAAGNDGNTAYAYPASYPSVVSVAAIDRNKNHATFSQTNNQVDLSAPGVRVLSTMPRSFNGQPMFPGVNGNFYAYNDGTSMSAPHVSGVAALLFSKNPTASSSTIVKALTTSAEDLGTPGRDDTYGFGLVNALAALAKV